MTDIEYNKNRTFTTLPDSGQRAEYDTGAVRDIREGKGRYDLIPYEPLKLLAIHYEAGAVKYEDRNWEKGIPLMRYLDSAMRHLSKALDGMKDENHLSACVWNIFGYQQTLQWIEEGKLPISLDDRPMRLRGE